MSNQMKEIDWSKAPGCAVAALVATTDNVHYPSVEFVTGYHAYGCMIRATSAVDGRSLSAPSDCWFLVDRPVSPWTGDGLPPVGTVCEAWHNGSAQGVVEVRYAGDCMVLWNVKLKHEQCSVAENYTFKPIRTPEQIAAEDREKAIKQMAEIMSGADDDLDCARRLYDANFRKVTP